MGPGSQGGSGNTISGLTPRSDMAYRPPSRWERVPHAVRTRAKGPISSEEPTKDVPKPSGEKEAVDVPGEEDDEDDRLRKEEDEKAEQRAKKRGVKPDTDKSSEVKKKKYVVRVAERFDVEEIMDRILEGHNHLMNLKDVLASAPRLRDELKANRFVLRMDPTALAGSLKNFAPSDPTIARWLTYIWMFDFELERIPKNKNRADGLSRVDWDKNNQGVIEDTPPVDGFLDSEEDVRLHINSWSLAVGNYVTPGRPVWLAPPGQVQRPDLVLKPYIEEDYWGMPGVDWMMELALAGKYQLHEDLLTMEDGALQVGKHEKVIDEVYLLANALLQEEVVRNTVQDQEERDNVIHERENDDFEEGEIKEAFRAEKYEGLYLELGMLLSCEMRERDACAIVLKMRPNFLVRDGHLFMRSKGRTPRRVVCGVTRHIDVMAALHDGTTGGHRSTDTTYLKIHELYYWDGMGQMIDDYLVDWTEVQGFEIREQPAEEAFKCQKEEEKADQQEGEEIPLIDKEMLEPRGALAETRKDSKVGGFEWRMPAGLTLGQEFAMPKGRPPAEAIGVEVVPPTAQGETMRPPEGQESVGQTMVEVESRRDLKGCQESAIPQDMPLVAGLRDALGSWATCSGSGGRGDEQVMRADDRATCPTFPEAPQQEVTSKVSEVPSSVPSQEGGKMSQKKVGKCFYCKKGKHRFDDCPKSLKDEANGLAVRESS
ncbi:hypothetical protein CBR_g88548 [Chara braunii]|uniref:Integrase zinc-binding domain-containing protein n=1 Tax=Chara braunii TaxID=69332 RepID=A0A388KB49_CHABU|nr:hypothetical protein CBR_g88548 [Chara braunii]|eukprot:GBG67259.1 hypothetical protein CBR_g88548 [Chara braunii]